MTEKKEKILDAALELFAKEGFKATSTNKVAKKAGVSEGLIFRHFVNKDGLLQAILKEGEKRAQELFSEIIFESDPKRALEKLFNLFTTVFANDLDREFWKLQYKLKWETESYGEHKMEPLLLALTNNFKKLGYANPEMEAHLLLAFIDGITTKVLLQEQCKLQEIVSFLKSKYNI